MRSEQEVTRAVEQYSDMVLRLCLVHLKNTTDAEDILQTVFLKYALNDKLFESPEHERFWIIRVTLNSCRDLLRSFSRSRTVPWEEVSLYVPDMTSSQYTVLEAVWSLPKHYREVIYLHYYEGYTASEIGKIQRKNPNTVYTHLSRAKKLLRGMLKGTCDETMP